MGLFDRGRKGKTAGSPAPAPKTPPEPQTLSAPEASSPELREAYPFLTVPCLALPRDLTPEALLRCWRKAGAEGTAPVLLRMDDMLCELLEDASWQGGDADIDMPTWPPPSTNSGAMRRPGSTWVRPLTGRSPSAAS